jgi:hypothetical protein
MKILRVTYAGIVITISIVSMAFGATPATHSDEPEHAWYAQQYNLRGGNCCGLGDAYILEDDEWKNLGDGRYSVKIDGEWHEVEDYKRRDLTLGQYEQTPLRGTPSPSHKAVVWYDHKPELRIWCFSPWENLY